jgi:hypothetical protein
MVLPRRFAIPLGQTLTREAAVRSVRSHANPGASDFALCMGRPSVTDQPPGPRGLGVAWRKAGCLYCLLQVRARPHSRITYLRPSPLPHFRLPHSTAFYSGTPLT